MDNIAYPRALNRPTYIVWRFTHGDVLGIVFVMIGCFMPKVLIESWPDIIPITVPIGYIIYKGCIVALKPRGWDSHVFQGIISPKKLNPGHTYSRCVVVEKLNPTKDHLSFLSKFRSKNP